MTDPAILIRLPTDRRQPGTLTAPGVAAPCLGKADNGHAIALGNQARNPLLRGGDAPCGDYRILDCEPVRQGQWHSYGPWKLRLEPIAGDCVTAYANGRDAIELHGGDLRITFDETKTDAERLRPTLGCLRTLNQAMEAIHEAWARGNMRRGDVLRVEEIP